MRGLKELQEAEEQTALAAQTAGKLCAGVALKHQPN